MRIAKTIRIYEHRFDVKVGNFISRHPLLGFLLIFVGMPLFILLCVCVSTVVIAFPMAWLFGWL